MTDDQIMRFVMKPHNPRECPKCHACFGLSIHEIGYYKGKRVCGNCGYVEDCEV